MNKFQVVVNTDLLFEENQELKILIYELIQI